MMQTDSTCKPAPASEAHDAAINLAIEKLVSAASALDVTLSELMTMFDLGMAPVEVVDYLHARLMKRVQ